MEGEIRARPCLCWEVRWSKVCNNMYLILNNILKISRLLSEGENACIKIKQNL